MPRPKRPTRSYSPLLTVSQAAARLAMPVRDLELWIRKGVVKTIRVGPAPGVIRIRQRDCDAHR